MDLVKCYLTSGRIEMIRIALEFKEQSFNELGCCEFFTIYPYDAG